MEIESATLVSALGQLKGTEFSRIASVTESDSDVVEISYKVEELDVSLMFCVEDPLLLKTKVIWEAQERSGGVELDEASVLQLSKKLCTHDLFVLIKRYQFLLNSSYRDESLKEFFTADRQANPTRIEFYPLMNLVTAYYESH
jgi:hypothetical protein